MNDIKIFGEKIELKVYVNQHEFVSDIQTLMISFVFSSCIINEFHNVVYYTTIRQ
jgi:hypothetical protein